MRRPLPHQSRFGFRTPPRVSRAVREAAPLSGAVALLERVCACGCGQTFKTMEASVQRFASYHCEERYRE